jgi:hypothetical protein
VCGPTLPHQLQQHLPEIIVRVYSSHDARRGLAGAAVARPAQGRPFTSRSKRRPRSNGSRSADDETGRGGARSGARLWSNLSRQVGLRGSASDPAALGRSQRVECVAKADGTAAGDSCALLTRLRPVPGCRSEPALSGTDRSQRVTFICPISKRAEFLKVYSPIRSASSFHAWVSKRSFEGGCAAPAPPAQSA